MLKRFWEGYFQEDSHHVQLESLLSIKHNLWALVHTDGRAKLLRLVDQWNTQDEQYYPRLDPRFGARWLTVEIVKLSGDTVQQRMWGTPRVAIANMLPHGAVDNVDIVAIAGIWQPPRALLHCMFEDICDDQYTLRIEVVTRVNEAGKTRGPLRDSNRDWTHIVLKYQEELLEEVLTPEMFQTITPFKVGDFMAPPLEVYANLAHRAPPAQTEGWAMYRLHYPTIPMSSQGGPWKIVAHRQGLANNRVCVQVRGHDSNICTIGLRLTSLDSPGWLPDIQ
jgi:hypothetical protein